MSGFEHFTRQQSWSGYIHTRSMTKSIDRMHDELAAARKGDSRSGGWG